MDDRSDAIWIEAPDAVSAARLMRESVGRVPARLVQCAGSRWRVVVLTTSLRRPGISEVISLVRCWLSLTDLRAAEVHQGLRAFTVHRGQPVSRDPCRRRSPHTTFSH